MAKALASIHDLGSDLDGQKTTTHNEGTSADRSEETGYTAPEVEPQQKKRRGRKPSMKTEAKGITPQSPTVYLLPEEKLFIKKLEAHILLHTGENVTDHQLIMDAVSEYAKKHYPDFKDIKS